ncbi:hypothetical protein Tco_0149177, partial [Tanacetum coccineum]
LVKLTESWIDQSTYGKNMLVSTLVVVLVVFSSGSMAKLNSLEKLVTINNIIMSHVSGVSILHVSIMNKSIMDKVNKYFGYKIMEFQTLVEIMTKKFVYADEGSTDGIIKHSKAISKSAKVHRKPPQSFTRVIELLLESIITFVPPSEDKAVVGESSLVIDMEIDVASSKGKGKAIASGSKEKEDTGQESSESLAKVYGKMQFSSSSHGGGIFHHILGSFLPHSRNSKREKNTDADWRHKLAVQRSPGNDIQAFVDLLDDVLDARLHARSPIGSSISREASATFIDVGLVRSLTRTLHMLDLDHAGSLKVTPALVKVLELVFKEHVHVVEANVTKTDNQVKPSGYFKHGGAEYTGEVVECFSTVQAYGGSEFVTDDMKHDQDIDGGSAALSEDDVITCKYL